MSIDRMGSVLLLCADFLSVHNIIYVVVVIIVVIVNI